MLKNRRVNSVKCDSINRKIHRITRTYDLRLYVYLFIDLLSLTLITRTFFFTKKLEIYVHYAILLAFELINSKDFRRMLY